MPKLTNQTAFDKVYRFMAKQQHSAVSDNGHCQYRVPDGSRCAIGCLIPNELYQKAFDKEVFSVGILLQTFGSIKDFFSDCDEQFLRSLQAAHDSIRGITTPDRWWLMFSYNMLAVAQTYSLQVPTIQPE